MRRADLATLAGLVLALGGVGLAFRLGGGSLDLLLQPAAALVVFVGTLGAVLIAHPLADVRGAVHALARLFREEPDDRRELVEELVHLAQIARRDGIVALDEHLEHAAHVDEPFLRRALVLVVDGLDAKGLCQALELELAREEDRGEALVRVLETAGGTAPTLGILGAVLGLIQVLSSLASVSAIGPGIAIAFVATLYGVGAANLLFLPAAAKLRARHQIRLRRNELIAHAALAIQQGEHPRLIADQLDGFEFDSGASALGPRRVA